MAATPESQVRITEVSLRDGLQDLDFVVPTELKAALVARYAKAGLSDLELTSFVRADRVPQLADAERLCELVLPESHPGYSALVPNMKGLRRAAAAGFHRVTIVLAASEGHSRANLGCDVAQALERAREVIAGGRELGIHVRAGISMAFGCSIDGEVPVRRVVELARALAECGVDEVSLADTAGLATPGEVSTRVLAVADATGVAPSVHLHDKESHGSSNLLAAVEAGVRHVDASLLGIGGCPYAPGAVGNVRTEEVVRWLGGRSGLDANAVESAASYLGEVLALATDLAEAGR